MMLTLDYLTTNQSEECPQADHITHNPSPSPCLYKPFPESLQGVQVFQALATWTSCLVPCNKCCTFLHHNQVSVDWLYCVQITGPKFGSVTFWPNIWHKWEVSLWGNCCIETPDCLPEICSPCWGYLVSSHQPLNPVLFKKSYTLFI